MRKALFAGIALVGLAGCIPAHATPVAPFDMNPTILVGGSAPGTGNYSGSTIITQLPTNVRGHFESQVLGTFRLSQGMPAITLDNIAADKPFSWTTVNGVTSFPVPGIFHLGGGEIVEADLSGVQYTDDRRFQDQYKLYARFSVPEPVSITLLATGIFGLAAARRHRGIKGTVTV